MTAMDLLVDTSDVWPVHDASTMALSDLKPRALPLDLVNQYHTRTFPLPSPITTGCH
jgi:hypothetical protein